MEHAGQNSRIGRRDGPVDLRSVSLILFYGEAYMIQPITQKKYSTIPLNIPQKSQKS